MRSRYLLLSLLSLVLLLSACAPRPSASSEDPAPVSSASPSEAESLPEPEPEPEPEPVRLTLFAAGDNLIHDVLYQQAAARSETEGGYDFTPVYSRVAQRIAEADIAFINQETMMDDSRAPSSYPMFNTPSVMASQLAGLGFDVANLANNHMLDLGLSGLDSTIDVIDAIPELTRIGAWREGEDKTEIPLIEREGVTFAFLGFAEYTNMGGSTSYRDRIVYTDDRETITAQMAAARSAADVVVVSVHFGTENSTAVASSQQEFALWMNELGADIVLGHHPHVIQPSEFLLREDGHRTLVFYSLGNFVSAQARPDNLVGLAPSIPIEQDPETGAITVGDPVCCAVVTHYAPGMRDVTLYPFEEYTDELASGHGVNAYGRLSLEGIRALLDSTVSFPVPGL